MAWVRFTGDYNFRPTYAVTIAYKAGMTQNVTRECATLAIAAGKAVRLYRKNKDDAFSDIPMPTVGPPTVETADE